MIISVASTVLYIVRLLFIDIIDIQELGKSSAFGCSELDMVLYEVEKVEKWEARCIDVVGAVGEDANLLLVSLQKVSS